MLANGARQDARFARRAVPSDTAREGANAIASAPTKTSSDKLASGNANPLASNASRADAALGDA
jgi:hypothetical protein